MGTETLAPLGEVKVWAVKDFPVAMRLAINTAADRRNMTVAEFLVRHFERYGIEGQLTGPITGKVPGQTNALPPLSEVREAVALAKELTPEGQDSALLRKARSIVSQRLSAMRVQPEVAQVTAKLEQLTAELEAKTESEAA